MWSFFVTCTILIGQKFKIKAVLVREAPFWDSETLNRQWREAKN